jgi:hypothetical protein
MKIFAFAAMLVFALSVSAFGCDESALVSGPVTVTCTTTAPVCTTATPAPEVFYEVPVTKRAWADETYVVNEKRVEHAKEVVTKVVKPNRPRAARVAKKQGSPVVAHKDVHKEKKILKPIKIETIVPVERTRKVAVEYQEMQLIPEREYLRRK